MKEILIFCDRKTRFVVKYVSFAELNEKKKKKKKSSKRTRISNEWLFYHYVSEDRKTMEMADERFFFFFNEFVFRFFGAIYSFHFFLSPFFFYMYIYHVERNFKHEAIVVWVFKDVTPAKMSVIDVRNDTGVDDKWHQQRLFRSFELLTSAAFMHGKKC